MFIPVLAQVEKALTGQEEHIRIRARTLRQPGALELQGAMEVVDPNRTRRAIQIVNKRTGT
jgi:hypothetical protein